MNESLITQKSNKGRKAWLLGNLILLLPVGLMSILSPQKIGPLNDFGVGNLFIVPILVWNMGALILFLWRHRKSGEWNMFAIYSTILSFLVLTLNIIYSPYFDTSHFFTFVLSATGTVSFILALTGIFSSQRTKKGTYWVVPGLYFGSIYFLFTLQLLGLIGSPSSFPIW